jgi:YbbR domain-containing protein
MRLRDYILNNFWLKVFSLIMAGMIWFAVQSALQGDNRFPQNPFHPLETREFTKTVAVVARPEDRQSYKITPPEARVTVRGNKAVFRRLKLSDIQVYVDLTEAAPTVGPHPIRVNVTRLGASQVEVRPQFATVETDKGK